ncbi:MAG: DUF4091 domain-containing protein [Acidobacteriota bacterium]|nr:DUF4091 domain-containing protein [Acidobacteriota bacterium]
MISQHAASRFLTAGIVLVFSVVACAAARGTPRLSAWLVDSLVKVFPSDRAGTSRRAKADYLAARNQHVSVQLAIRSRAPIEDVTASVPPLIGPADQQISGIVVHPVGFVVVGSHTPRSPADERIGVAPGLFPDPLMDFPLNLKSDWTTPVWITIHVPDRARPGVYRGEVRVRAGGRILARVPFRLRVLSAHVPQARTLDVTNWFNLNPQTSRQFFGVQMFSPSWWTLAANVAHVLAEYRQNVILTPLMELIQPRNENGNLAYDYSNFDRWVETFQKAGAIGTIEGSHLTTRAAGAYNGALMVPVLLAVNGEVQRATLPVGDSRVAPFLTSFLSGLYSHLQEKGWTKIYLQHISDEPHGAEIAWYGKLAAIVHHSMPGIRTIDAVDVSHMPAILQQNVDIWVPVLSSFDQDMSMIANRVRTDHAVWYYTCITPQGRYINRFIDFPLVKTRLLPWLDFRYGLTGFLHWGGNSWTPEPMLDTQPVINNNQTLLPPGDAFILYPDRKGLTVRSSIRLEAFRSGIEDYEMLRALSASHPDEASQLAREAIASFTDYVRTPGGFRGIERQLLEDSSKPQEAGVFTAPQPAKGFR